MDWAALHSSSYSQLLQHLEFEPRPSKCFRLESKSCNAFHLSPDLLTEDIADSTGLQTWLAEQSQVRQHPPGWPMWSTTILALQRGPPNEYEINNNASGDQLHSVGCTKQQFEEIVQTFELSRTLPYCIMDQQSYYAKSIETNASSHFVGMKVTLRTGHLNLRDLALCSVYNLEKAEAFNLLLGCGDDGLRRDFDTLEKWLRTMNEYAGHPMLIVALFQELHLKRLNKRYRELIVRHTNHLGSVLRSEPSMGDYDRDKGWRAVTSDLMMVGEALDALDAEVTAFRLRLPEIISVIESVTKKCPQQQKEYMRTYGWLLKDNLGHLRREAEYLQTKVSYVRGNTDSLSTSVSQKAFFA